MSFFLSFYFLPSLAAKCYMKVQKFVNQRKKRSCNYSRTSVEKHSSRTQQRSCCGDSLQDLFWHSSFREHCTISCMEQRACGHLRILFPEYDALTGPQVWVIYLGIAHCYKQDGFVPSIILKSGTETN